MSLYDRQRELLLVGPDDGIIRNYDLAGDFEWEEVVFVHDKEEYAYRFHFQPSKITFKRIYAFSHREDGAVQTHPTSVFETLNTAIIVLYKIATSKSLAQQDLVPRLLKILLGNYESQDALRESLDKEIKIFPTKSPIAETNAVMDFLKPYYSSTVLGCISLLSVVPGSCSGGITACDPWSIGRDAFCVYAKSISAAA